MRKISQETEGVARAYANLVSAGTNWIDVPDLERSHRDVCLQVAHDRGWIEWDIGPNGMPIRGSLRPGATPITAEETTSPKSGGAWATRPRP